MDIPATSDNIPGTVVLRDNTGDCSVGDLRVNGNLQVGSSNSSNFISFRGTDGDDQTPFTHSFVGERIYAGGETSELLLFKGNDPDGHSAGPDRIRLVGANIALDTYPEGTFLGGSFGDMGASSGPATRLLIKGSGNVGIGTTTPSEKLEVNGTVKAAGFSADGIQIEGLSGRNYFRDEEQVGELRVGAAWGIPGIYSENGRCVVGGQAGVTIEPIGAGNVGIGTSTPNSKAMLDISSTTRGFLPPRMTEAQRDAITSPPAGLMLYNSTTNKLQVRTDTAWVDLH